MDDEEIIMPPDESAVAPVSPIEEVERVKGADETWGDYVLAPDKPLSPRHRKLAELLAQGRRTSEIAKELDLTEGRISVLKSNTKIKTLTNEIAERIYQETVGARIKQMVEPALNNVHMILTDVTNRVKISEKADMSKWIIEMEHGKAKQTHDIGENMLSVVMDRLDALKNSGKSLPDASHEVIDLVPQVQIEGQIAEKPAEIEDDYLKSWIADFTQLPK